MQDYLPIIRFSDPKLQEKKKIRRQEKGVVTCNYCIGQLEN
jgi:hypothetical protein